MENRIKNKTNALFFCRCISTDKEIAIDSEILMSDNSLKAIKKLLKNRFPDDNCSLRKYGVISVLNRLFKEGLFYANDKQIKITACEGKKKSSVETEALGNYLVEIIPDNPENVISWNTFSGLYELGFSFIKNPEIAPKIVHIQTLISERYLRYLILSAQNKKALNIVTLISKRVIKMQKSQHHKAIFTAYKAEIFRMMGKNGAAEKLLHPMIVRLEKKSNLNQIPLAQLYDVLGMIMLYDDKLRFSEAEKYLQRAFVIRQMNFGEHHISTISSNLHLAEYYNQMGAANKVFECVKSPMKHIQTNKNSYFEAWANDIMGLASYFAGNKTDAINYCEKGLLARRQFLKKGHPMLLESLHNVGYLLLLSRKSVEAIQYINQTYAEFKNVYTPEHQNYTVTVGVTALCNLSLNKVETAENILVKEADEILKYPRENYKLYAVALFELINHYTKENNQTKEKNLIEIYIKLLQNRQLKFDKDYSNVLNRYLFLSRQLGSVNDVQWAKQEISDCLYDELQQKTEAKSITVNLLNTYGVTFKNSLNDYQRAEECYILNLELDNTNSTTYSNYALLLTSIKNEHDRAEVFYLKSIELDCYNETALGNYAFFLQNIRKKFTKAEILYQESLRLSSFDRCCIANYASLKLIQGDIDEAKKLASKSLKLCIPSPNRFMARVLTLLIIIRIFECKNYDDLLGHLKFLFAYGMDHVTWDNRELMVFAKRILCDEEFDLVQKIFNTINDYNCITELQQLKEWKEIEPLPFVSGYRTPFE
jgi:hypothetical protein